MELHRLYDRICSAETESRRRNERLLERVAETEARASALARQTERLRSLVRQTSAVSGNAPCRLGELIRREKMLAVNRPIWTAANLAIDETISHRSKSINEDNNSFLSGNLKLTTEIQIPSRTLTNAGTQTVDVTPPLPVDISSELTEGTQGSAWWKEQKTTELSDASDVKVTPHRLDLPVFDEVDSSDGGVFVNAAPDGLDVLHRDPIQSLDGRDAPEAPPDRRDSPPATDSAAILNNVPEKEIETAPISTKVVANVATSLLEDSSSDEEEYDPFFNFDFVKKKIPGKLQIFRCLLRSICQGFAKLFEKFGFPSVFANLYIILPLILPNHTVYASVLFSENAKQKSQQKF